MNNANTFSGTVGSHGAGNVGQVVVAHPAALQYASLADGNDNTIAFASGVTSGTLGGILSASQSQSLTNAWRAVMLSVGNNNATSRFDGGFTGLGGINKVGAGKPDVDRQVCFQHEYRPELPHFGPAGTGQLVGQPPWAGTSRSTPARSARPLPPPRLAAISWPAGAATLPPAATARSADSRRGRSISLNAGSLLRMDISSTSSLDQIFDSGALSLGGGTLMVPPGLSNGKYQLINYTELPPPAASPGGHRWLDVARHVPPLEGGCQLAGTHRRQRRGVLRFRHLDR